MATLHDVARQAAVSTATVSHVINNNVYVSPKLRARVLKAIRACNYQPNMLARNLRTNKSKTVGVVVPDIADPFFPALVRGAEDVLADAGYTLLMGSSDNDQGKEEGYYRTFLERRVDGLLAVVASDRPPEYVQRHDLGKVPIVFADRAYTDIPADFVGVNNSSASKMAVEHLVRAGYRRIATVTGPLHLANARERLAGYRQALENAGRREDPPLIREGNFDVSSGYAQTCNLLNLRPRPDAIFIQNPPMTLGAFRAIQEWGLRCPTEIGLISFGETDWFDVVRPAISTVFFRSYDIGATAAEVLLRRLAGQLGGQPIRRNVSVKLLARESTERTRPQGSSGKGKRAQTAKNEKLS
ncbi:MAG TPA: LacI family DNA-binding transcriptional regulator [Terriglobales bacterium]|nr:LacI family DNA-binding transcriptional regulator [Terriglobales bacterium]